MVAVVGVDHGNRRTEVDGGFETFVRASADLLPYHIVELAHMELCEPSISTAFDRCVAAGTTVVVIAPKFFGRKVVHCLDQASSRADMCPPGVGTGRCALR